MSISVIVDGTIMLFLFCCPMGHTGLRIILFNSGYAKTQLIE